MNLGFVGVGKWAQKLAEQFRECGASIVAHDRKTIGTNLGYITDPGPWGRRRSWMSMVEDEHVDAIIAVADPETTTKVALACAEAGKPVMATKPLVLTEMPKIRAPFYVDLWRLWGDRWARAKVEILASPLQNVTMILEGCGPMRGYPGPLDYGPHLMAFLFDAFTHRWEEPQSHSWEIHDTGAQRWTMSFHCSVHLDRHREPEWPDRTVTLRFGNASESGLRRVLLGDRIVWDEPVTLDKSVEIRAMCQAFLSDIHESYADAYTLDMSVRGMRCLKGMERIVNVG